MPTATRRLAQKGPCVRIALLATSLAVGGCAAPVCVTGPPVNADWAVALARAKRTERLERKLEMGRESMPSRAAGSSQPAGEVKLVSSRRVLSPQAPPTKPPYESLAIAPASFSQPVIRQEGPQLTFPSIRDFDVGSRMGGDWRYEGECGGPGDVLVERAHRRIAAIGGRARHFLRFREPVENLAPPEPPPARFHPVPTRPVFAPPGGAIPSVPLPIGGASHAPNLFTPQIPCPCPRP